MVIFSGAIQGVGLAGACHAPHFWMQLVSVVLVILVGFLFLTRPGDALMTLTLLLIMFFMVEGVALGYFAERVCHSSGTETK